MEEFDVFGYVFILFSRAQNPFYKSADQVNFLYLSIYLMVRKERGDPWNTSRSTSLKNPFPRFSLLVKTYYIELLFTQ